jgi:hypothetical protein
MYLSYAIRRSFIVVPLLLLVVALHPLDYLYAIRSQVKSKYDRTLQGFITNTVRQSPYWAHFI